MTTKALKVKIDSINFKHEGEVKGKNGQEPFGRVFDRQRPERRGAARDRRGPGLACDRRPVRLVRRRQERLRRALAPALGGDGAGYLPGSRAGRVMTAEYTKVLHLTETEREQLVVWYLMYEVDDINLPLTEAHLSLREKIRALEPKKKSAS